MSPPAPPVPVVAPEGAPAPALVAIWQLSVGLAGLVPALIHPVSVAVSVELNRAAGAWGMGWASSLTRAMAAWPTVLEWSWAGRLKSATVIRDMGAPNFVVAPWQSAQRDRSRSPTSHGRSEDASVGSAAALAPGMDDPAPEFTAAPPVPAALLAGFVLGVPIPAEPVQADTTRSISPTITPGLIVSRL